MIQFPENKVTAFLGCWGISPVATSWKKQGEGSEIFISHKMELCT